MPRTSLVLLSLILSSLIRHQRLTARLDLRLRGLFSTIDCAFSDALSLSDRKLCVRDSLDVESPDGGDGCSEPPSALGADVGAGPRGPAVPCEEFDESDCSDGESNVKCDGIGDARSLPPSKFVEDSLGLCMAEAAADGSGLAWRLYAPSRPNEAGVENGTGCTCRRNDS